MTYDHAEDAIYAARFKRTNPAPPDRRMSQRTREEWLQLERFAASQFRIVRQESADAVAKAAQAVAGLQLGLMQLHRAQSVNAELRDAFVDWYNWRMGRCDADELSDAEKRLIAAVLLPGWGQ